MENHTFSEVLCFLEKDIFNSCISRIYGISSLEQKNDLLKSLLEFGSRITFEDSNGYTLVCLQNFSDKNNIAILHLQDGLTLEFKSDFSKKLKLLDENGLTFSLRFFPFFRDKDNRDCLAKYIESHYDIRLPRFAKTSGLELLYQDSKFVEKNNPKRIMYDLVQVPNSKDVYLVAIEYR